MAGHSKWSNIQHRKNAQDAKRGQLFTKLIREITVAARTGGIDSSTNARLRLASSKALAANVSRDTIDRAIKRGAGNLEADHLEEIRYEGYGPSGVAVLVETLTDNRNRTAAEVRHAFSKYGGNLGTEGSVAWMFHKKGIIRLNKTLYDNPLMELALEVGAEDILNQMSVSCLITEAENLETVCDQLKKKAPPLILEAEIAWIPTTYTLLPPDSDEQLKNQVIALLDHLEDLMDVQTVYSSLKE